MKRPSKTGIKSAELPEGQWFDEWDEDSFFGQET